MASARTTREWESRMVCDVKRLRQLNSLPELDMLGPGRQLGGRLSFKPCASREWTRRANINREELRMPNDVLENVALTFVGR
jgi:hypothetical protein